MKKIIAFLFTIILAVSFVSCAAPVVPPITGETIYRVPERFTKTADYSDRNGKKRNWDEVSSYFCNYGTFQDEMLKYDVAIMQRNSLTDADMQKLEDAGVWTIAYITLGEDYSLNVGNGMGPGGYASYYLYDGSESPIPNGDWGSYYVDPGHPDWINIVLNEVQNLVDSGADGIFMDTCDSVDAFPQTLNSMYNLISIIRENFPDIKMVLNRGFTLVPTLYPILDGVMFELFTTYLNQTTFVYDMVDPASVQMSYNRIIAVETLNAVRQDKYFPVFSLEYFPRNGSEATKQMIYDFCWEFDFIPYLTMQGRELAGELAPYSLKPNSSRGKKALSVSDTAGQLELNGDISSANLAFAKNGAKINVSSSFNGYNKSRLNDGYVSNEETIELLGWAFANWASAEEFDSQQWIEIITKDVVSANKLRIDWGFDDGVYYSSRKALVQAEINGEWVTVAEASDISSGTEFTEFRFTLSSPTNKYRILQPEGYGPQARRNLMWISEVSLYA